MKRVKTKWVLNLPEGSKLLAKKGDQVVMGQVLAEVVISEEKVINLGISLEKYKDVLLGKSFKKGEVMLVMGGFFKKKINSPIDGLIEKVDEYNNIYFKLPDEVNRKIISPTEAVVSEIEVGSISLEFRAVEFEGVGLVEGRVWGKNGIKIAKSITDLTMSDNGKILIIEEINPTLVAKAEVMGITGVIVVKDDKIKSRLPILKLEFEEFKNVLAEAGNVKRAMLNANSGRLLLVI